MARTRLRPKSREPRTALENLLIANLNARGGDAVACGDREIDALREMARRGMVEIITVDDMVLEMDGDDVVVPHALYRRAEGN